MFHSPVPVPYIMSLMVGIATMLLTTAMPASHTYVVERGSMPSMPHVPGMPHKPPKACMVSKTPSVPPKTCVSL